MQLAEFTFLLDYHHDSGWRAEQEEPSGRPLTVCGASGEDTCDAAINVAREQADGHEVVCSYRYTAAALEQSRVETTAGP